MNRHDLLVLCNLKVIDTVFIIVPLHDRNLNPEEGTVFSQSAFFKYSLAYTLIVWEYGLVAFIVKYVTLSFKCHPY